MVIFRSIFVALISLVFVACSSLGTQENYVEDILNEDDSPVGLRIVHGKDNYIVPAGPAFAAQFDEQLPGDGCAPLEDALGHMGASDPDTQCIVAACEWVSCKFVATTACTSDDARGQTTADKRNFLLDVCGSFYEFSGCPYLNKDRCPLF